EELGTGCTEQGNREERGTGCTEQGNREERGRAKRMPEMPEMTEATIAQEVGRPTWDEYFMTMAHFVATRATCTRRQVGAVIVRDKRILTTGYNGSPPGLPHCSDVGCWIVDGHCVRTIHAEQNALVQAA